MKNIVWQALGKEGNPNSFQLTLETNQDERIEEIARILGESFGKIEDILEAKILVVKGWTEE